MLEGSRDIDGFGSSGQPSGSLITWGHQNANRLFYDSSNFMPLALSDRERAELVQVSHTGAITYVRHGPSMNL